MPKLPAVGYVIVIQPEFWVKNDLGKSWQTFLITFRKTKDFSIWLPSLVIQRNKKVGLFFEFQKFSRISGPNQETCSK
jgi:hypothetical protein